jgi:hypothetical protein
MYIRRKSVNTKAKKLAIEEFEQMLASYEEVKGDIKCDLFHLRPNGDLCCLTDGYNDAQWFELTGYNIQTGQRVNLGRHDGLDTQKVKVLSVRIMRNGETMIQISKPVKVLDVQDAVLLDS